MGGWGKTGNTPGISCYSEEGKYKKRKQKFGWVQSQEKPSIHKGKAPAGLGTEQGWTKRDLPCPGLKVGYNLYKLYPL